MGFALLCVVRGFGVFLPGRQAEVSATRSRSVEDERRAILESDNDPDWKRAALARLDRIRRSQSHNHR